MRILPWNKPLTNIDIIKIVEEIPCISRYFRGVFSKDQLCPLLKKTKRVESFILNLDNSSGPGSHWGSVFKKDHNEAYYYDSYGNLGPPRELVTYLTKCEIFYNRERDQEDNTFVCGQLCLCFLYEMSCGRGKISKEVL